MNFFPFTLCVLATASLFVKSNGNSSSSSESNNNEVDDNSSSSAKTPDFPVNSLARMTLSHLYYQVGLDISNIDGIITLKRNTSHTGLSIQVCPEKLIGYGGINGKEDLHTRVIIPKLFQYGLLNKSLKEMANGKNSMSLRHFRALCLECAKFPEAIVVVDVAILTWIVEKFKGLPEIITAIDVDFLTWIAEKVNEDSELMVDFSVIKSVCLLSVHPNISVHCESQIIRFLEICSKIFHSKRRTSLYFLLNLLKFIDSSIIREKVKTIITSLYNSSRKCVYGLYCRLVLGPEDPFLAVLEKKLPEQVPVHLARRLNDLYPGCYFIFYSKGQIFHLPRRFDVSDCMNNYLFIRADIINDDILQWKDDFSSWKNITFACTYFPSSSLFIVCEKSPPSIFWAKIKLCKNLKEFKELLMITEVKQLILSYDITVMESNIQFTITSPSKQLDNQDPNV